MKVFDKSKPFKLYISPYKLPLKNNPQPLEGSLLSFDFGSDLAGYSDFLPWPSYGEQSLAKQLKHIQKGVFCKRFLIAKHNAFLDAKARQQKRNLLFGLNIPDSHYLIEDLLNFNQIKDITEKHFQTVKVKLKAYKIPEQVKKLRSLHLELKNKKWRLDLNGQSWLTWKEKLNFIKADLDFIEDPLLNTICKKEDKKLFAEDWIFSSQFQIKIAKPSRDSLKDLLKGLYRSGLKISEARHSRGSGNLFKSPENLNSISITPARWKRIIFTHSFDHPLGQVITAFWAGTFYKHHPRFFETGAFTHNLFKPNSYSLSFGQKFLPPTGYGFGFNDSLKKEKWKRWL